MLFIYFNLYSGLPIGFYYGFITAFFIIIFLAIYNFEISVLTFIFFIPLFGFLGPLFHTQDAYVILIMSVALITGYLINCIINNKSILSFNRRYNIPVVIMLVIMTISFILVVWRLYLYDFKMYGFLKQYIDTYFFKTIKSTSIIYSIFFTGLLFQIIMTETKFSKNFINNIFYVIFFSFFIVFIIGIYQKFFNSDFGVVSHWTYENNYQINSTLRFANTLGEYLIFIVPIFIGFLGYYYKISKTKVILSIITIINAIILLYFNGNRTGILGVAIALIFYIVFYFWIFLKKYALKKIIKNYVKNIIASLIIVIIIISLLMSSLLYIKNIEITENSSVTLRRLKHNFDLIENFEKSQIEAFLLRLTSGRNYFWTLAIDMFKDLPITGVGIGQYEHMLPEYNIARYGKVIVLDAFALNFYLNILAELGIFYLLSFLWMLAEVFIIYSKKIKSINNKAKPLYMGIFLALVSSLIAYNFNAGTAFIEIQYMFSLVIGLIVNESIFKKNELK